MFAEKPKEDLAKFSIFVNSFRGQKKTPESRGGTQGPNEPLCPSSS
jgi:hypothetical protein